MTMEQLLAGSLSKPLTLNRGDEVEGKVIAVLDNEVILDLGTKSEGIINKKELSEDSQVVGATVKAFVTLPENESGQVQLSIHKALSAKMPQDRSKRWQRFIQAMHQNSKISGKVVEVNKGGLLVEVDGVRGFLPTSQISFKTLSEKASQGLDNLVGNELSLNVIEVNASTNRLIFSDRSAISDDQKSKLSSFTSGQTVKGKVVAVVPFGVFLDIDGLEGIIFTQEISWDKVDPAQLQKQFPVGETIEAIVSGIDETIGRLNLSIRQLSEDPFEKLVEDFQVDDVVKGTVKEVDSAGVKIELDKGMEGFMGSDKLDQGTSYEVGQTTNFLVDSIDKPKRRINLAPFLTSTQGLIYK